MEGLPTAPKLSSTRPPGPKNTRPWLGVLPLFRKDPANYLLQIAREYGDLAYMRLGPQHAFVVSDPTAATFSMMMLGSTEGGDAYTFKELDA
jgi:hypothetical protein